MSRFAKVLQHARDRLQVPEPSRSRILLEMAADLEDSYQHYRTRGYDESESMRRAEEAFGTSEEALRHLVKIHTANVGGFTDRLSRQIGRPWEKILLLFLVGFEMLLALRILTDEAFFVYVSPFIWPLAALALAAFAVTVWKLVQIFSRSQKDVRQLREGLSTLLFFAGASLAVAGCGFLLHLQRFFRLNFENAPEALFVNFAGWMIQISSMMTLGLLTAILVALIWFVLSGLVGRAERNEVDILLQAVA